MTVCYFLLLKKEDRTVARKDEVNMNCKYCGCSLEDDDSKYCPECGKALFAEDEADTSAQEETVEENADDEIETVELSHEDDEELYEHSDEDVEEEQEENSSYVQEKPSKGGKGGAIIAAFAAILVIGCIVVVFAVSSMQKKKEDTDSSNATETASESTLTEDEQGGEISGEYVTDDGVVGDYSSYEQYVTTLGDYVGVEIDMTPEEVTDEEVESQVSSKLAAAATTEEITDRTDVEEGDIANIDYTGYIDGEAFAGGTDTGYDLTIGSGTFIPGFEDGLIGATVGETVEVNVTFPEDYANTDYAGKDATFEVTVNSISQEIVPELTDEWVANNSEYTNVDEYKESIRTQLEETNAQEVQDTKASRILGIIYENSELASYPEDEIQSYVDYMTSYYEYYASMFGTDLEGLVYSSYGMTTDEFTEYLNEAAKVNIGTEIICYRIAALEGMTLTDDEYQEGAQQYATDNGYETVEEFEAAYTKSQIYDRIIMDKVMDFVSENSVEVMGE